MCAVHHVNFDLPIITFTKPVMILLGRLLATTIKWKYVDPKRGSEKMLEVQTLLKMKNGYTAFLMLSELIHFNLIKTTVLEERKKYPGSTRSTVCTHVCTCLCVWCFSCLKFVHKIVGKKSSSGEMWYNTDKVQQWRDRHKELRGMGEAE